MFLLPFNPFGNNFKKAPLFFLFQKKTQIWDKAHNKALFYLPCLVCFFPHKRHTRIPPPPPLSSTVAFTVFTASKTHPQRSSHVSKSGFQWTVLHTDSLVLCVQSWVPLTEFLTQWVWDGAWEFTFLVSSQMNALKLVWEPLWEPHVEAEPSLWEVSPDPQEWIPQMPCNHLSFQDIPKVLYVLHESLSRCFLMIQ